MLHGNVSEYECRIINLDSFSSSGTQRTCYYKKANTVYYFDSGSDINGLNELIRHLKDTLILTKFLLISRQHEDICIPMY